MKKLIPILMIGFMLVFTGCPDKKDTSTDEGKVNVMRVDLKAAKVLMDNYMRYLMKRDNGAMRSFYGADIKLKLKKTPTAVNPHPVGYSMNEGETKEKKAKFKVHVFSGSTDTPYFSDDEYTYVVAIENGKMVISDIVKGKSLELFERYGVLYKREGDKLKGEYLISLVNLPNYVVPKESSSIEQKFALPKKAFGPCAMSPDGKTAVITSFDKDCFIGTIEEASSETMAQQPQSKSSGGPQGGGGASQGGENQGQQISSEKTNMNLKTVDFYFASKVNSVSFSPDGEKFIVEYTAPNRLSQIMIYKASNGEPVKIESNKQFRKDRFSITRAYFSSPEELIFTVVPAKNATPEESKFKGDWKLDVKKGELKQIE